MRLCEITDTGSPLFVHLYIGYEDEDGGDEESLAVIKINGVTDDQAMHLSHLADTDASAFNDAAIDLVNNNVDVPGNVFRAELIDVSRGKDFGHARNPTLKTYGETDVDWLVTHAPDLAKIPAFSQRGIRYNMGRDGKIVAEPRNNGTSTSPNNRRKH